MATITKIEIDGFKAFPNNFSIDLLDGKNLLIYGENGSGKSSLYYALHVLMQSVFKDDKGAKYFKPGDTNGEEFIPNNEQLININRFDEAKANTYTPNIRITFDDGKIWKLDNGGLQPENGGSESDIRMLNKYSAFINHSYISRFHAARNSEEINLWNVFYKDILPFYVPAGTSDFLADLYDNVKREYNGGVDIKNKAFQDQITKFNDLLNKYIDRINIRINSIYNDNFKNEGDKDLNIKLIYYSKDHPDNVLKEQYYLFCEKITTVSRASRLSRITNDKEIMAGFEERFEYFKYITNHCLQYALECGYIKINDDLSVTVLVDNNLQIDCRLSKSINLASQLHKIFTRNVINTYYAFGIYKL